MKQVRILIEQHEETALELWHDVITHTYYIESTGHDYFGWPEETVDVFSFEEAAKQAMADLVCERSDEMEEV